MIRYFIQAGALGLSLICGANIASAQTLEYDCDTQAEHFSVLKAVQAGPIYSAGGNISPRELFATKKFATLGMLQFEADDKSWRVRLGITGLMADKKPILMGTLQITRGGKAEEPQSLGEIVEYKVGAAYPISLRLGQDGGSATLGSHSVPVNLQAKGKVNASVVCSGGEFLFTDLKLSG